MKKIIKLAILLFFVTMAHVQNAQTICSGESLTLTAINSLNLSNPSYSLNPGGITSQSATFVVTPLANTTYTMYVTGTNSSSLLQTTTNTATVSVNGSPTFGLASPQSFTLGCNSKSVCVISIINANTVPSGGPVSYTILPPGGSAVLPSGSLGVASIYSVTTAGSWSVVVRDNTSYCSTWTTVTVSANITPPVIGSVSVPQTVLTCTNQSEVMQVTPAGSEQYAWSFVGSPGVVAGNSISVGAVTLVPTATLVNVFTLTAADISNTCESTTVIPIYQNVAVPNASISNPGPAACAHTIVLTNVSITGIANNTFPVANAVAGYLWEGPSPQVSAAMSSTYLAQSNGIYTLTAMDMNNGCMSTATIAVTLAPTAAFVHTISSGLAVFNDASTSTNGSLSYYWDFGDGNTSTLQNPTHTYTTGGAYFVKLKIVTPLLCSDSVIQSVTISGVACAANSNFSMVPTGTAQVWNVIPSYPWNVTAASWNWGDGSSSNTLYTSHQYSAAAMYNICLSVTVSCGDTSTTCTSYSVYRTAEASSMLQLNVIAPELISGLSSFAESPAAWHIAPNPNTGAFKLHTGTVPSEPVHVLIRDLSGRMVYETYLSPELNIQADLAPGMYLVQLEAGAQRSTMRMVVER